MYTTPVEGLGRKRNQLKKMRKENEKYKKPGR